MSQDLCNDLLSKNGETNMTDETGVANCADVEVLECILLGSRNSFKSYQSII